MKKFLSPKILILTTVILLGGVLLYWKQNSNKAIGNLNVYEGKTTITRAEKLVEGRTGIEVKRMDGVKINTDARASIVLKNGGLLRLESGSEVEILGEDNFKLKSGRMWSRVEPLSENESYSVETPTAVATVRGTIFNVYYLFNISQLYVDSGLVNMALLMGTPEEKKGKETLSGELFVLRDNNLKNDFAKGPVPAPKEFYDDWIQWNVDEDAKAGFTEWAHPAEEEIVEAVPINIVNPPKQVEKKITSIFLYGNKSKIKQGEETRLLVRASYPDGSVQEVPFANLTWIKSEKWGNITSPGYFGSNTVGTTTISAQIGNLVSNRVTVVIEANPVVPPPNPNTYYEP